ncbi:hypothetical protein D9M69_694180 [compost metagenome]
MHAIGSEDPVAFSTAIGKCQINFIEEIILARGGEADFCIRQKRRKRIGFQQKAIFYAIVVAWIAN